MKGGNLTQDHIPNIINYLLTPLSLNYLLINSYQISLWKCHRDHYGGQRLKRMVLKFINWFEISTAKRYRKAIICLVLHFSIQLLSLFL